MPERRAIRGYVVGDELAEEGPAGLDGGVGTLAVGAQVGWSACPTELMQRPLVCHQPGQVLEQPPIAAPLHGCIDPFGRQAVIPGDPRGAHAYLGVGGSSPPA